MLKEIKNKLKEVLRTKNFSEYSEIVNNYVQILEKNYDEILESDELSMDFLLFYSFIEDFWYTHKDTIKELDNSYYDTILMMFKTISRPIKKMVADTGILEDKNKVNKLRSEYFNKDELSMDNLMTAKDFKNKTDKFKGNYTKVGAKKSESESDVKELLPEVGNIYRCKSTRKTKSGVKFTEGQFYQIVRNYKGAKSGTYHVVLFNVKDEKETPIDSYFINFQKHFENNPVKSKEEVDEILKEEEEEIKNTLPPVGFVRDLK